MNTGYLWCYSVAIHGYGPRYSVSALITAANAARFCGASGRAWAYVKIS